MRVRSACQSTKGRRQAQWMFNFAGRFDLLSANPWNDILLCLECSGDKICSEDWRFYLVAAKCETILALVFVQSWLTGRSMGMNTFALETPELQNTWSMIPDVAFRRRNLLPW